MRVVSNTSPLSNLAIIGRLSLLGERYGKVAIPPTVWEELAALKHPGARGAIEEALAARWVSVETLPESVDWSALLDRADPGECAAIALAEAMRADKILLDDRSGRELARERGLKVSGVLGELLYAKRMGRVVSVRDEMKALQSEAHFFIREDLGALILAEAGE
jgi:uncharacterized protein